MILRERYNAKSDVYSFAILLWEMLSLAKPYGGMDGNEVKENVASKGLRPKIPKEWPTQIRMLLKYGWARRPDERPTMAQIKDTLEKMLVALASESSRHTGGSNKFFKYSSST
jgi:serine/threonine-protein kinase CTR1